MRDIKQKGVSQRDSVNCCFIVAAVLFSCCVKNPEGVGNTAIHPQDTALPQEAIALDNNNFSTMTSIPGRVALIELYSPKCGACLAMDNIVAHIALEYKGKVLVGIINIWENGMFQRTFGAEYWPTFIFLKGGQETRRIVGVAPEDSLTSVLDSLLFMRNTVNLHAEADCTQG